MRRMLIIEDEPDLQNCLADFFSSRGFSVTTTFSGEEALERLAQGPADVILLDILLPGISGMEVLKRIKERCPRTKVIMVTGLLHSHLRFEAEASGASGYVTKPFDFSDQTWAPVFTL